MKTLFFLLLFLASCTKEPDNLFDPDCGVIASKIQAGDVWITVYRWNDGSSDTIAWHFDPVSMPGDTICKLKEVNLEDYQCKP